MKRLLPLVIALLVVTSVLVLGGAGLGGMELAVISALVAAFAIAFHRPPR